MKYLLEIGTEELPYKFISSALNQLKDSLSKILEENKIEFKDIITYGTPRRLCVIIDGISESQPDLVSEIKGPPASIAFDTNGNLTNAALGFAKKQNILWISVSDEMASGYKKDKKDLIYYTRDEYLLPILSFFSKRVCWECHNLPDKTGYYLKFWKKCSKIITITNLLKKELIKLGIDEKNIVVAADGVDLKQFALNVSQNEARQKLNLPFDKKIILYCGHLYKWKGAEVLAQAALYLPENYQKQVVQYLKEESLWIE